MHPFPYLISQQRNNTNDPDTSIDRRYDSTAVKRYNWDQIKEVQKKAKVCQRSPKCIWGLFGEKETDTRRYCSCDWPCYTNFCLIFRILWHLTHRYGCSQ